MTKSAMFRRACAVLDAETQNETDIALEARQRLLLFVGTPVSAEEALSFTKEQLTLPFLLEKGVTPKGLCGAGLFAYRLKEMGMRCPSELLPFGFCSMFCSDPKFCTQLVTVYGAKAVRDVFLKTPTDALILAVSGSHAIVQADTEMLLQACVAAPMEAAAIITRARATLRGVDIATLLNTGLRAPTLVKLGITQQKVANETRGHPGLVAKLGYRELNRG